MTNGAGTTNGAATTVVDGVCSMQPLFRLLLGVQAAFLAITLAWIVLVGPSSGGFVIAVTSAVVLGLSAAGVAGVLVACARRDDSG